MNIPFPDRSVFDPAVFRDPPARFRPLQIIHGMDNLLPPGLPLDQADAPLTAGLERLAHGGVGGVVTNVSFRDYLTDSAQWDLLRKGLRAAQSRGLRTWIYDEKGYPSGTAGGYVTRANPRNIALGLACYTLPACGGQRLRFALPVSCRAFVWAGAAHSLEQAVGADFSDLCGQVDAWGCLDWTPPPGDWQVLYLAERYMYEGTHSADNVSDFKFYINALDSAAVRDFIRVTHEAYARELPADLWQGVDAFFTDEPSLMTQYLPPLPERFIGKIPVVDGLVFNDRPPAVAWSEDFLADFERQSAFDLRPGLYALFHSFSPEARCLRQAYYAYLTRRYSENFFFQIRDWCREHGVESSGHVLLEESILDHPGFEGSLLGVLRGLDLPGIDMLNSSPREMLHRGSFMGDSFMAIKQASSAAHLAGRSRVHSESSDWEQQNVGRCATLDERRGQANIQYALGVNLITSYFGWEELGEEAKRAYHDYAGRLSALLTGGQHICDVAVLYPIRTAWANTLPPLEPPPSWAERQVRGDWLPRLVREYPALVKELLLAPIDVDIIDDEGLAAAQVEQGALRLSGESYRAVILPPLDALGLEAARALERFILAGGLVIATGQLPTLAEDPAASRELNALMARLPILRAAREETPAVLRARLGVDVDLGGGSGEVLYTHRRLEGREVYFLASTGDEPCVLRPRLRAPGPYTLYRPLDGRVETAPEPLEIALSPQEGLFIVAPAA